jgi:hypothetical protein
MFYRNKASLVYVLCAVFLGLYFQDVFAQTDGAVKKAAVKSYNNIQRAITKNEGQFDSSVKFSALDKNANFFFTSTGPTILLSRETVESKKRRKSSKTNSFTDNKYEKNIKKEFCSIKLNIIGANKDPEIIGEEKLPWNNNYFMGNDPAKWQKNVPNFSKIRLKSIYENIDLVYYFEKNSLKYDFYIYPGADPEKIRLQFDTGDINFGKRLEIDDKGDLQINTPFGYLIEKRPICYQIIDGEQIEINAGFKIIDNDKNIFSFELGERNTDYPVVIDPEIIYSTFLGGTDGIDWGFGIEIDQGGNAYLTGQLESFDFPVSSGVFMETSLGSINGFVSKLNSSGTALEFSTYIGSTSHSEGLKDIEIDSEGNVYVAGWTHSLDYPVTANAFDKTMDGSDGAVVTKLNSNGSELMFSTYLDGSDKETVWAIDADDSGFVYVTGITSSHDFPTTPGAFDEYTDASQDGFVSKINTTEGSLVFSTYLGGGGIENCYDIVIDNNKNIYITGNSESSDFPTTDGAFNQDCTGDLDVFVTKLSSDGSSLLYSTFIGGSKKEFGYGIAIDKNNNSYVTGITLSEDFPVTYGAYDTTFYEEVDVVDQSAGHVLKTHGIKNPLEGEKYDIFVTKLNSEGNSLVYSTYIGGNGDDFGRYPAVDNDGNVYITGYTESTDYPTSPGAYDRSHNGNMDVFVSKLNSNGTRLLYSSYFGGAEDDIGYKITIASDGNAYLTGWTASYDFPVSSNVFDESYNGGLCDIFVMSLDTDFMTGIKDENDLSLLRAFNLKQNYPNPFNSETAVKVELYENAVISLDIYNILGQKVRTISANEHKNTGIYTYKWDGTNDSGMACSSGLYICTLTAGGFKAARKMVLLK